MTSIRHEYAAASRNRRLTRASALFSASARCLARFRVPASAPVERDLADAVPETRPLALDALFFGAALLVELERVAEPELAAPWAVPFAAPRESAGSEPSPRRGRRGRLLTCAPPHPHSPRPLGPPRPFQSRYPGRYCSNALRARSAGRPEARISGRSFIAQHIDPSAPCLQDSQRPCSPA